LLRVILMI